MFTFSNNTLANTYSMRPKKANNNQEHLNINREEFDQNDKILNIDLKSINIDNMAVELALNVLMLKHNIYNEMTQHDIIQYYNNKIKLTNNISTILSLKIILKHKFKGLNVNINKLNGITINDNNPEQNNNLNNSTNLYDSTNFSDSTNLTDFKFNNNTNNNNFKITQNNANNNFKITQNNTNNNFKITQNNQNFNTSLNLSQNNKFIKQNSQPNITKPIEIKPIETFNGQIVSKSLEFDIDSIINSYSKKKTSGLVK